jgi:hypothetical protein
VLCDFWYMHRLGDQHCFSAQPDKGVYDIVSEERLQEMLQSNTSISWDRLRNSNNRVFGFIMTRPRASPVNQFKQ